MIGDEHQPLRVAVSDEIRRRIIAGALPQGERIREEELAAELGVSRNPVREALQTLTHEGFVEIEPRRGARVMVLSDERAGHLFEVREVLEGLVAALAAKRRTLRQLGEIERVTSAGLDAVPSGELAAAPRPEQPLPRAARRRGGQPAARRDAHRSHQRHPVDVHPPAPRARAVELGRARRDHPGGRRPGRRPGRRARPSPHPQRPRRVLLGSYCASGSPRRSGGRQKPRVAPPSTRIAAPVTKLARALHRNTTTSASSSGRPRRPIGMPAR